MEGLIVSFRDACKRDSLPQIKECFEALVRAKRSSDLLKDLEYLEDLEDLDTEFRFEFGRKVNRFFDLHELGQNDRDRDRYLVKLAYGTVYDWRNLNKRVVAKLDMAEWTFLTELFDYAEDLTTAEEAKRHVEKKMGEHESCKRVVEAIEECWRDDEAPTKKRIKA